MNIIILNNDILNIINIYVEKYYFNMWKKNKNIINHEYHDSVEKIELYFALNDNYYIINIINLYVIKYNFSIWEKILM